MKNVTIITQQSSNEINSINVINWTIFYPIRINFNVDCNREHSLIKQEQKTNIFYMHCCYC